MASRALRLAASILLFLAAPGFFPYQAAAQSFVRAPAAPIRSAVPVIALPASGLASAPALLSISPSLTFAPSVVAPAIAAPSAAIPLPAPALLPAPSAVLLPAAAPLASAPSAKSAPITMRLAATSAALAERQGRDRNASGESSSASADAQFRLLTGETLTAASSSVAAADGAEAPRPSGLAPAADPTPDAKARTKAVRLMIAGTAAMKSGMETVTLAIPILVLQGLGGAALIAGLGVVYGVAQAAAAGAAGGLLDRFAPQKVLAGGVIAQAALVGGVIALGATGLLNAFTLIPIYILIGGAVGIAETARQSIPARLLGADGPELAKYNARLHIFYESAGVAGALTAGVLMAAIGPLWALLVLPPAYLTAAWLFSRVRVPAGAPAAGAAPDAAASRGVMAQVRAYVADARAGARLILSDGRMRWLAVAFILPQIVHRVFENLLLPVYAKSILGHGGYSAYLLTASNLGELVGAALLLRFAAKIPAPRWVKRGALGLLLGWALIFTHSLPILLPLIVAFSMTWSSSDLSLRAEVQSSLSEKDLPRATSFLYGAFVLSAAAVSMGLGAFLDHLAPVLALPWIIGLFTAIGAAVYYASSRLKRPDANKSIK